MWRRGFQIALAIGLSCHALSTVSRGSARAEAPIDRATGAAGLAHQAGPSQRGGLAAAMRILGQEDVARYRRIHALQAAADWPAARAEIDRLHDDVLLGHLQAQKYLHPTGYRSRFRELRTWMAHHADHPQAARIHKLARKRMPAGATPPREPVRTALPAGAAPPEPPDDRSPSPYSQSRGEARTILQTIRERVRRGWPTGGLAILNRHRNRLSTAEQDDARGEIARGYFRAGKDGAALDTAGSVSGDSAAPVAHWWGGLAAWRLGRFADAQHHFATLAHADSAGCWTLSAGAYWAARAALATGRPQDVSRMHRLGARCSHTFYGVLSRRALGLDIGYDWDGSLLSPDGLNALRATPRGRRGLALLQVGLHDLATAELRALAGARPELREPVRDLADLAGLPKLSAHLSGGRDPRPEDMFPAPAWEPKGGFAIDRALIYALVRQESRFDPEARSPAGARGLMQLMPDTARYVAGRANIRASNRALFDPAINLALGQHYVQMLLDEHNDLFSLATAYNAGPGNLRRWLSQLDHGDDPLFFIESLPSRETRHFIERVLTNFWIYRDRFGQPTPSLDDVVAGAWPYYQGLDSGTIQVSHARH